MSKYKDIADTSEDDRINQIGKAAMGTHGTVAFVTDDDVGKADRYLFKLFTLFPDLELVSRFNGPVKGTVSCIVQRAK